MLFSSLDRERPQPNLVANGNQLMLPSAFNNNEPPSDPSAPGGFYPPGVIPQSPLMYPMFPPSSLLPPGANGMFNLRCIACGVMCKSMVDLHQHIMQKHLAPDNSTEPDRPPVASAHRPPVGSTERDFQIPKPNFMMMLNNNLKSAESHRRDSVDSLMGMMPQVSGGQVVMGVPFPQVPDSVGAVNPFLSYQNLINSSVMPPVPPGVNMGAGINPYMAYPGLAVNGMLSSRFPYVPGLPMVPPSNDVDSEHKLQMLSSRVEAPERKTSFAEPEYSMSQQSRQADMLRRRMSAPLIGLNNRFMLSYNRTSSGAPNFDAVPEQNEDLQRSRHKRRESVPDKASSSRINAKSIEQHISKLISNNEKLLTNPVLERVKPRRVFRRNSLDPASLSSYSATLNGQSEGFAARFDEDPSSKPFSGQTPPFAVDPSMFAHGMSTAEYNKMIQLHRAPNGGRPAAQDDEYSLDSSDGILGKRSMSISSSPSLQKKARRSTFFECSDCGVRYRKEENYVIHKQVYCKFRKENGAFPTTLKSSVFKSSKADESAQPEDRASVIRPTVSSSGALPAIQSITNSMGTYTKILPPFMRSTFLTDPMKLLHNNELCRTKSADAALQGSQSKAEESKIAQLCRESDKVPEDPSAAKSSIPTNKLPPNKRHMHLLRCSDKASESSEAASVTMATRQVTMATSQPAVMDLPTTSVPSPIFSEMSVPRSNYKLLLHQISLRNMQDIHRMNDSSSQKKQIHGRRTSVDHTTTSEPGKTQHFRSFSTCTPPSGQLFVPNRDNVKPDESKESRKPLHSEKPPPDKLTEEQTAPQADDELTVSPLVKHMDAMLPNDRIVDAPNESSKPESQTPSSTKSTTSTTSLLFPHLQPSVSARSCVTFCCVLNPQPSYTETPLEGSTKQLSTYSDWAVSEPILLPNDLSIVDVLRGWKQPKSGDRSSISTNCAASSELISTDNKSYEAAKSDIGAGDSSSAGNQVSDPRGERATVPTVLPSPLAKCAAGVYASCQHSVPGDSPALQLGTLARAEVGNPLKRRSPNPIRPLSESDSSEAERTTPGSIAPRDPGSNGAPGSNGSTSHFGGKTKRRKTRRERNAASPREQRRSLHDRSPSSPKAQAVHHGAPCSSDTDERLRGCSLCSIKAGRPDLVPDLGVTCQPCQAAQGASGTSPRPKRASVSTPMKFSSPPAHNTTYLDRTRASTGSTQHWVVTPTQGVFRYPSPTTGVSEVFNDDPDHPGTGGTAAPAAAPPPKPLVSPPGDPNPVSPSLAEVVSEVMRSAAMQSKRHQRNKITSSRPLHPHGESPFHPPGVGEIPLHTAGLGGGGGTMDYVLPWTTRPRPRSSSGEKPWLRTEPLITVTPATPTMEPTPKDEIQEKQVAFWESSKKAPPVDDVSESDDVTDSSDDVSSEGEHVGEGDATMDIAARPFRCSECKVAFRIGGHLAKHLRSKGHTVAMQKKTLNRLKQQRLATSSGEPVGGCDPPETGVQNGDVINTTASKNTEFLAGSEVLARSQVRALFEGNEEYACVPPQHLDDVYNDVTAYDVTTGSHDPRPFKCLACKVAFRFQGHLDRHFRSNLHLIAVGHYEHGSDTQRNSDAGSARLSEHEADHVAPPNGISSPHNLPHGGVNLTSNGYATKRTKCEDVGGRKMALDAQDSVTSSVHALVTPL